MRRNVAPLLYDDLLHAFEESLDRALSGAVPAQVTELAQVPLMLALLDVTRAVRERRPTRELVTRARAAFGVYADNLDEAQCWNDDGGVDAW